LNTISFTINKVVQPAQIHMYVDGEMSDAIKLLSDSTSNPVTDDDVTRPEGV
jgi:hypothetical protein